VGVQTAQAIMGQVGQMGGNIPPAPFKGGDATGKHTRTILCRDRWDEWDGWDW